MMHISKRFSVLAGKVVSSAAPFALTSSLRSVALRGCVGACLAAAGASPAWAQPGGSGPASSVKVTFSHSAESDADLLGISAAGTIAVDAWSVSGKTTRVLRPGVFASVGATWEQYSIDAPVTKPSTSLSSKLPVPEKLRGAALDLSGTMTLDAGWMVSLTVSPGFYSAGSSLGSDGFNVPGLLLGTRRISPTLSIAVGLRFDGFSDNSLLPVAGLRWQPTPEWLVSVGAPRTEAVYTLREGLKVFGGASLQGGGFAVDDRRLVSSGKISLRDTYVDYQEIRAGLGVRWDLNETLALEIEGGWIVDQRFDYYERSLEVTAGGTAFGHIALSTRF